MKCNQNHIQKLGLDPKGSISKKIEKMFCPDIDFFENILGIQNDYHSSVRHSFQIELIKCTMGSKCKSD